MKQLIAVLMFAWWLTGIVVAKGFWMTLLAIVPIAGHIIALHWFFTLQGWL